MQLKSSRYNFFFPYDDRQYIAFNGFTCAMALLEKEKYLAYEQFLQNGTPLDLDLQNDLIYGGFVLPKNMDELDLIRNRMLVSRYDSIMLALTIAPTLACNFRCPYCLEGNIQKVGKMPAEVQEQLLAYIENYAGNIRGLHITWYGGEPLLAMDVIESLSARMLQIAERHNLHYSSNMVTNGYLLTEENYQKLAQYKVSLFQITLDGPPETHDQRRILHSGQPTFATILHNIKMAVNQGGRINIRVNVDYDNLANCEEVISLLKEEGLIDKVHIHFSLVKNSTGAACRTKCIDPQDFSTYNLLLWRKLNELGIETYSLYPRPHYNLCGADQINCFVIDPSGFKYKCWADIGRPEQAVGKLSAGSTIEDRFRYRATELAYLDTDPTRDPECSECKFLPFCLGGCPHDHMYTRENYCTDVKYQLEGILKEVIEQQLKAQRDRQ